MESKCQIFDPGIGHLNSGPVFKWWSVYLSINQTVICIRNYHGTGHLNIESFDKQTNPNDLNTQIVCSTNPTVCTFNFRGSLCPEDVYILRGRIRLPALPVETFFPTLGRGETGHQQRRQLRGLRHLQVRRILYLKCD